MTSLFCLLLYHLESNQKCDANSILMDQGEFRGELEGTATAVLTFKSWKIGYSEFQNLATTTFVMV